jgi:elongation factor G
MASVDANKVRNVGILGHGGAGKTMLIEHILFKAGKTSRVGKIADGNTVGDYLDEEKERQQTISLKLMNVDWKGSRIHMVDHPGYVDFIGEVAASTPLLDGLVILVDATTGVQVGTDNAWKYAEQYGTPRAFFVNKLDRENSEFDAVVEQLRRNYGLQCVPLVIPIGKTQNLTGVVNTLTGENPEVADQIAELRAQMTDAVAESDDQLLEKYLETGELSPEQFHSGLQNGISSGKIVPIIAGSVEKNLGIEELLDIVASSFPSPLNRKVAAKTAQGEDVEVKVSADAPFLGQVFRSIVDPFVGQLTLFRVLTGTLRSDSDFYNVTKQTKERTGKLFLLNGKEQTQVAEVVPGDLAAMTKLKNTHFGDTIAAVGAQRVEMPKIELPTSMVRLAIVPKSRADEDKLGEGLNRLAEEDPTFTHYRDKDTGEHVVKGTGDLQLEILLDRMKRKYGIEVETKTPKVAFKETIKRKAEAQGKHKKQTGGHGQYGDVHLRVQPNARGGGSTSPTSTRASRMRWPRASLPAIPWSTSSSSCSSARTTKSTRRKWRSKSPPRWPSRSV